MRRLRPSRPALALQHGHQYLITDGYENREGISEVIKLAERYPDAGKLSSRPRSAGRH
ncbi:MAG: hypothetical protein ACRDKW_05620 [Actinomycetota bacterium]